MHSRTTILLLNIAHAVDHMFLLIFATAVATIAADFGFARWEDLMPYGVGAFVLFGLGSLPAGRLGDLWGRRIDDVIFFFGMGAAALLAALAQEALAAGGGADPDRRVRVDLPPGRHSDAGAARSNPGADDRHQRARRQSRHRGRRRS